MSDEDVLRSSSIYARGQEGSLAGTRLVGPRSYPLLDWLTVPYPPTDQPLWSHQVGGWVGSNHNLETIASRFHFLGTLTPLGV